MVVKNAIVRSSITLGRKELYNLILVHLHCTVAVFPKVNLIRAYHQIPVHPGDVPKTAVNSFGLFKFLKMPFGLQNAAQTFQRFVDHVFSRSSFEYAYIDGILIAS